MKSFVFSLDAFVAFTLALIAIYSLIFFSSIPSSYYYLMTQGHFLTRDVLLTLSTTDCTADYNCPSNSEGWTVLDKVASSYSDTNKDELFQNHVDKMIPGQFGYAFEFSTDNGNSWSTIYDTRLKRTNNRPSSDKKMKVSALVPVFKYISAPPKRDANPFRYLSCGGQQNLDPNKQPYLISCGNVLQTEPKGIGGGDFIPNADSRIVRLTVFI